MAREIYVVCEDNFIRKTVVFEYETARKLLKHTHNSEQG